MKATFGADVRQGVEWDLKRSLEDLSPLIRLKLDDAALVNLIRNPARSVRVKVQTDQGWVTVEIEGRPRR